MTNPFDLRGPEFLLFYCGLAAVIIVVSLLLRHWGEPDPSDQPRLTDPYSIAYLRGGEKDLLSLVTVGLIDRNLLEVQGDKLCLMGSRIGRHADPLEHAVLSFFQSPRKAPELFGDSDAKLACRGYRESLETAGLIPNTAQRYVGLARGVIAAGLLWGVAAFKVLVALERGRRNVGFLVALAIAFGILALLTGYVVQTRRGEIFLDGMRSLMSHLKERSSGLQPRNNTSELLLLGAVFGLAAVPAGAFPHLQVLYPAGSSGTGSSCGSGASDSGGGSGCGGGGCGGGCGGCGS